MAFPPELVAFLIAAVAWALWRVSHNFISRSPLDNIPGPTPPSWVKGTLWIIKTYAIYLFYTTGNLGQIYDRHGWEWIDSLGNNFNKVVKLTGLYGVGHVLCLSNEPFSHLTQYSIAFYTYLTLLL